MDFDVYKQEFADEGTEAVVLGCLLLEPKTWIQVSDKLNQDCFFDTKHKLVFKAISQLWNEGKEVDILTVVNQLRNNKDIDLCSPVFVSQLTNRVGSTVRIVEYVYILKELEAKRSQVDLSRDLIKEIKKGKPADKINEFISKRYDSLSMRLTETNRHDLVSLTKEMLERLDSPNDNPITGVPSGHSGIDRKTGGFQKSDLIILAGRPGMGKTSLALSWMRFAGINAKKKTAIFSLEMSAKQLLERMYCQDAEIKVETMRRGNLSEADRKRLTGAITRVTNTETTIVDDLYTIEEIAAEASRIHLTQGLDMIVIDYLQLASSIEKTGNREQEVSIISRKAKMLAKRLNVPVVALAQLSRNVEQRGGEKIPQLSDLRESGSIEQDADMVGFVYRPEYYNITETAEGVSTAGLAVFRIAKNRHGALDDVNLRFKAYCVDFTDYEIQNEIQDDNNEDDQPF